MYWWEGRVEEECEWVLVMKTDESRLEDVVRRLRELHPYQVPEIIATEVTCLWKPYEVWLKSIVCGEGS